MTIAGGQNVTLLGGTILGAHGSMGSAIVCNGAKLNVDQTTLTTSDHFGIDSTNCVLTVTRSRIEFNLDTGIKASGESMTLARTRLAANTGGGADVGGGAQFTIVGNEFVNNGSSTGAIGGIGILTSAPSNRLEFNSIAENKALSGSAAGITCTANLVAENNIVWNNNGATGLQVSTGCGYAYSDIGPTPITGSSDMGNNQDTDPKFKGQVTDLHLTPASPLQLLQRSDPGSNLTNLAAKDIDGEPRVAPVYIGADQYSQPK